MKVGKEEMVGLLVAVERYFLRDHEADQERWLAMCKHVAGVLEEGSGIDAQVVFWESRGIPAVSLSVKQGKLGLSNEELAARLRRGNPPVYLWKVGDEFCVVPSTLKDGEEKIVGDALRRVGSLT